jgi:hypothetical protein
MEAFPNKKWNSFFNIDWHSGVFMNGPVPVEGGAFHIGAGSFAAAWIGLGSPKNNGDTVLCDGMPIVSRTHEVKYCIVPHWNVVPFSPAQPNVLIPLLVLGSSSKCLLASRSVRCKDGPVATSLPVLKSVGLNQACADPCNMPSSMTFNWGSVIVGITAGDVWAAVFLVVFDMAKSALENYLFGKAVKGLGRTGFFPGMRAPARWLIEKMGWNKLILEIAKDGMIKGSSFSQELVNQVVGLAAKSFYSESQGGKIAPLDPIGDFATTSADEIGDWVDGRSEKLPSHHGVLLSGRHGSLAPTVERKRR